MSITTGSPVGGVVVRLARVLHGSSPVPVLALERDGALYDAAELDRIFGTRFSPDHLPGASDFHTRVVALGGAGLETLDERLRAGDRPAAARLLPGTFVWLPPCDTDRAAYVQLAPYDEPSPEPLHRLGDARSLLGHESPIAFPSTEERPSFELGVAALLWDDLSGAEPEEAERAVFGYTILNGWSGADAGQSAWTASRVPAQLGPVVVSASDVGDLGRLKAQARIDGKVISTTTAEGCSFPLAAALAWVSRWTPLRGGDVVGLGCLRGGRGEAPFGAGVDLLVERLGKLTGRPVRRPR